MDHSQVCSSGNFLGTKLFVSCSQCLSSHNVCGMCLACKEFLWVVKKEVCTEAGLCCKGSVSL
jgi:hypothetical protein